MPDYEGVLSLSMGSTRPRIGIVISGGQSWGRDQLAGIINENNFSTICWVSDTAPEDTPMVLPGEVNKLLGRETDLLVFDAFSGFNPDAFGLASGTVRGGGALVILMPDLESWWKFNDPEYQKFAFQPKRTANVEGLYLKRFASMIDHSKSFIKIHQGREPEECPVFSCLAADKSIQHQKNNLFLPKTRDQLAAVQAIIKVATGHRRRPLVMSADRGRGKTIALAIAGRILLEEKPRRIAVTAPRFSAVKGLFLGIQQALPDFEVETYRVFKGEAEIFFIPPDRLLIDKPKIDLLFIDEAAAIPAPILESLLRNYSRVVFSSTIHGYEGTGRGFEVRFKRTLNKLTPQWRGLTLNEPVRWPTGDAVEQFVFDSLLLNAEPAAADIAEQLVMGECEYLRLDRAALVKNEQCLRELFGLLVLAHYRTSPNDLRVMLDAPDISVYGIFFKKHIVATLLLTREGGFSTELCEAVWRGERRPRGHLMAQSLTAHLGLKQAASLRSARIIRIAVHPAAQRKGLGKHLVDFVKADLAGSDLDYIGSSFGATVELDAFWRKCGLEPVRLGFQREASSGEHALMVVEGISTNGRSFVKSARQQFVEYFPFQLAETYRDLEPALTLSFLNTEKGGKIFSASEAGGIDANELQQVDAFIKGYHVYESCSVALWKYLIQMPFSELRRRQLSEVGQAVLVKKVLQKKSWAELLEEVELAGKKQAVQVLRQTFAELLIDC